MAQFVFEDGELGSPGGVFPLAANFTEELASTYVVCFCGAPEVGSDFSSSVWPLMLGPVAGP